VDTSGEDTLQMSPERAFDRRKKKENHTEWLDCTGLSQ